MMSSIKYHYKHVSAIYFNFSMSIYSGFATRKIQSNYNNLLAKLISFCQSTLISLFSYFQQLNISNQFIQFNFQSVTILSILKKMQFYEEHKYLEPKFSKICQPLKQLFEQLTQNMKKTQSQQLNEMDSDSEKVNIKKTNKLSSTFHNFSEEKRQKNSSKKVRKSNQTIRDQMKLHIKTQNFSFRSTLSQRKRFNITKQKLIPSSNKQSNQKVYKSVQKQRIRNNFETPRFIQNSTAKQQIQTRHQNIENQSHVLKLKQSILLHNHKKPILIKSSQIQKSNREYIKGIICKTQQKTVEQKQNESQSKILICESFSKIK